MPRGTPKIGSKQLPSSAEELVEAPKPELIGTLKPEVTKPKSEVSAWLSSDSAVEIVNEQPPWELEDMRFHNTDARRFVEVPKEWELRWINPRLLDQYGWRDWRPVMASDPGVKVKVKSMVMVDNNIRRGPNGDILAWMPKHWVESRKKIKAERIAKQTARAVERHRQFSEEVARGSFGRYIMPSGEPGKHPTHTIGEGSTMTDE